MYRYKQNLAEPKKVQQPKPEAWSVRKSSTHRVSPYTKQETSQLLKADQSKGSMTFIKQRRERETTPNRTKSSKLLGAVRAALVQESRNFNVQLKALEPTIKALSPRHRVLEPSSDQNHHHHHMKKVKGKSNVNTGPGQGQHSPLFSQEDISRNPTPATTTATAAGAGGPTGSPGEKLITIGGYIVSLQPTPQNVTSSIRPRISSDREGLELEVKILGCHQNDIKFEKRYDTLIVIGVTSSPAKKTIEERKLSSPIDYNKFLPEGRLGLGDDREIRSAIIAGKGFHHHQLLPQMDNFDEIHEVINIFVPKNVSLNQIFISKPDAKGRIFVKGP